MSYLDVPRIYFAGKFMARPPTGNNRLDNYDPSVVLQTTTPEVQGDAEWHPRGTGEFRFLRCMVTAVVDEHYQVQANHPLVHSEIGTFAVDSSPKIVDLDPDQQNYAELFGMRITFADALGKPFLTGLLDPPPVARDTWTRIPGEGSVWGNSGFFQSVLTRIERLSGAALDPTGTIDTMLRLGHNQLSMKFVVDNFGAGIQDANKTFLITDPNFATGRLVGIIGPAKDDEPATYLAGRRLLGTADKTVVSCAPAPCVINTAARKLTLDLSNSIQWQEDPEGHAGDAVDGTFFAGYRDPSGAIVTMPPELAYTTSAYMNTAGIYDLDLTDAQLAYLVQRPILVVLTSEAADVAILAERPDGVCIENEPVLARLNAGETATVELRARKFGVPLARHTVGWRLDAINRWNNLPADGVSFATPLTTDALGRATLTVTANRLHNLPSDRRHIQSQVYFLGGPWDGTHRGNAPGSMGSNTAFTVLVFAYGEAVAAPRWRDVQPILAQYNRLYPGMRAIVQLDSLTILRQNRQRMLDVLSHKIDEPNYMPVTRDLPAHDRQTLLNWLNAGCPE